MRRMNDSPHVGLVEDAPVVPKNADLTPVEFGRGDSPFYLGEELYRLKCNWPIVKKCFRDYGKLN